VIFVQIPQKTLAVVCKSLGTMQHAGVPLLKALDTLSKRTGNARCRRNLKDVLQQVQQGTDIAAAMRNQGGYFPDLTIDMVHVGEQTGQLPEVLDRLADHYENNVRLRRMFLGLIAWPVIQLVAAIFIVGILIWFLGVIAAMRPGGESTHDILGLGLLGTRGAIIWFAGSFGTIFGVLGTYFVVSHVFDQQRALDSLLLGIPVIGGCMRSFAIARFSWAFALTQQTGMPIARCIDASLRATNNGAFAGASRMVQDDVLAGEELSTALGASRLFPDEYLQMVQVAETSGTVPETLERLSPQFEDQARRALVMLATVAAWAVWIVVAGLIIFLVISFFVIEKAASGNF
jgi:type IV pilus assembly protein PilC